MIHWFIQLWDLLVSGVRAPHLYFIFGLFTWMVWITKITLASRYEEAESDYTSSTSVVIPVYNEKQDVLRQSLRSIIDNNPDEIIAVVDSRDPTSLKVVSEFEPEVEAIVIDEPGKRKALKLGIRRSKNDIVVLVDSDSIWTSTTLEKLLKPFADPDVGGVCSRNKIFRPTTLTRRLADWLEDLRFNISFSAQSHRGVTSVLTGRTAAYRREHLITVMDELVDETFLGKPCTSGDDGRLTYLTLKHGYKTVYQPSSIVYTDVPTSGGSEFRGFIKQRIRWWRNSTRRIMRGIYEGWIFKRPLILPFSMISSIISPFFLLTVLIVAAWRTLWIGEPLLEGVYNNHHLRIAAFLLGITITRGIRSYPNLIEKKREILLLPFYALISIILLVPIRIYSFLTMNNQRWLTREVEKTADARAIYDLRASDDRWQIASEGAIAHHITSLHWLANKLSLGRLAKPYRIHVSVSSISFSNNPFYGDQYETLVFSKRLDGGRIYSYWNNQRHLTEEETVNAHRELAENLGRGTYLIKYRLNPLEWWLFIGPQHRRIMHGAKLSSLAAERKEQASPKVPMTM